MKKHLGLLLLFILNVAITSCKKSSTLPIIANVEATIRFTGDPAYDGCGWFIITDTDQKWYKPINLDDAYKQDKAKVIISYTVLNDKFYCGKTGVGPGNDQIELKNISLK